MDRSYGHLLASLMAASVVHRHMRVPCVEANDGAQEQFSVHLSASSLESMGGFIYV